MHMSKDRPRALDDQLEDTMDLFLSPDQIRTLEESARSAFGWKPRREAAQAPRLRLISLPERRVMTSPADVPVLEMAPIDRVIAARTG
jgi:hypothetical protein